MEALKEALQLSLYVIIKLFRWIVDKGVRSAFDVWFRNDSRRLPPIKNPLLLESATSLASKLRGKEVRCQEVVQAYIERIKEVQSYLNAVVEDRFEEALREAAECDRMLADPNVPAEEWARNKPLLGIPFTVKDSIGVRGTRQTLGLRCRKDFRAESDAEVVARVRGAGAIPVAITNIPELVMWFDSNNKLYGRTNNPYNLNRIPGGSSGGEGAVLSAAASLIGIGSDIGGSIRFPAFYCGIFGHKPSIRLIPNDGILPTPTTDLFNDMAVVGPMCRYASDLLPVFKVMVGPNMPSLRLDEQVDLRSLRVYYMEDEGGNPLVPPVQKDIKEALRKVVDHFSDHYSIECRQVFLPQMKEAFDIWYRKLATLDENMTYEIEMGNRERKVNPFPELLKSVVGASDHTLPMILWSIMQKIGSSPNQEQVKYYLNQCEKLKLHLTELLGSDGIFLIPGNPETAPYHHETLWKIPVAAYTGIFNALGFPATMCPMGLAKDGLPVGIQVVAGLQQDRLTLAVARELEIAFGGWVSPSPVVES